jgi:hypothetical protein
VSGGLVPGLTRALGALWAGLRAWSGDSAWETYAARTPERDRLGREAFYLDTLQRRYRRPNRCC